MMKYISDVVVVFIVQYLLFIAALLGQSPTSSTAPADEEENFSTTTTAGKNKLQNALEQAIQNIKEIMKKDLGIGAKKEEKKEEEDPNAKKGVDNKKAKKKLAKKIKRAPHIVGGRGVLPAAPANPLVARPKPVSNQTGAQGGNDSPVVPPPNPTVTRTTSSPFGTGGSGTPAGGNFNPPDIISKLREILGKRPPATSAADKEEEKFKKEEERRKLLLQIYKDAQSNADRMLALCKEKFGGDVPKCINDTSATAGCQKIAKEPLCRELCFRCINLADAIDKLSGKSSATTPDQSLEELAMPENEFAQLLHLIEAIENKFADTSGGIGEALAIYNKFLKIYNGLKDTQCSEEIRVEFFGIREGQTILNYVIKLKQEVVEAAKKADIYQPKKDNDPERIEYFYNGQKQKGDIPQVDAKYYGELLKDKTATCFKELVSGIRGAGGGEKPCMRDYASLITSQGHKNYEEFVKIYTLFSGLCWSKNDPVTGAKVGDPLPPSSLLEMLKKIENPTDGFGIYLREEGRNIGLPLLIYTYIAKKTNPALFATLANLHDTFANMQCSNVLFHNGKIGKNLQTILQSVRIGTASDGNVAPWIFNTDGTINPRTEKYDIKDVISGDQLGGSYFKTILQNVPNIENEIESKFAAFQQQFCSAMNSKVIELLKGVKKMTEWTTLPYLKPTLRECVVDARVENPAQPDTSDHCCDLIIQPLLSKMLDDSSFENFKNDTGYTTVTVKWERYFNEVQSVYFVLMGKLKDYITKRSFLIDDCRTVYIEQQGECSSDQQSQYDLCAQLLYAMVAKDSDFAKYIGNIEYRGEVVGNPIPKQEHYIRILQEYTKSLAKLKKILDSSEKVDVGKFNKRDESTGNPNPTDISSWEMVKKALGLGYIARDTGATYAKALSCKALLNVQIKSMKDGNDTYYLVDKNPLVGTLWDNILLPIQPDNGMVNLYNNFFNNYYSGSYLGREGQDSHFTMLKNILEALGDWSVKAKEASKTNCGTGADQTKCYLCVEKKGGTSEGEWAIIKYLFFSDKWGETPDDRSDPHRACADITEQVKDKKVGELALQNKFNWVADIIKQTLIVQGQENFTFTQWPSSGILFDDRNTNFKYLAKMFFPELDKIEGRIDALEFSILYNYLFEVYGVQGAMPVSTINSSIIGKIDSIVDGGSPSSYLLCGKKKSSNKWTPLKCKQNVYAKDRNPKPVNHGPPGSDTIEPNDIDATAPSISLERFYNGLSGLLGSVSQVKDGGTTNIYWYKVGAGAQGIGYSDNESLYKNLYQACVGEDLK